MTTSIVKDEDVRRVRALKMFELRVAGVSLVDIGKQFNCTDDTVRATITWAAKNGLVQAAEQQVLADLVPKAIAVYATALENGDTFAAKHIIDKLAEMADRADRAKDKGTDRMFEVWMKDREERKRDKSGKASSHADVGVSGPSIENVLDAETIPAEVGESDDQTPRGRPARRKGNPFVQASTILDGTEPGV